MRGDADWWDRADQGPLLFPDHRSGWRAKAEGRHRRALAGWFLIRRRVSYGAGPILADSDGKSAVEPWTVAQVLLGQLRPPIVTAVRGRYSGADYYCVVDFAVDAVPGSLFGSVADQRRPGFELSNWLSTYRQRYAPARCAVTQIRWDETLAGVGDLRLSRHFPGALDAGFERPICRATAAVGTSITADESSKPLRCHAHSVRRATCS